MTESEVWKVLFDLVTKIDEKTDRIPVIEERVTHLVTKEECQKRHAESSGIAVNVNGKKVMIGAGIIAALGTAVAAIIQAL